VSLLRRSTARRATPRFFTWLVALGVLACEAPPTPTIAIASAGGYLDAARMAIADAQQERPDVAFDTVVVESNSNAATDAVAIATRFLETPGLVGVVGHVTSSASLATSQLYNEARVLQLSPTATSVLYSQAGSYSYRMVPPDDRQARFLCEVVCRQFQAGARVALLYVNDDYGRGLRTILRASLDTSPLDVVLDVPHAEDEQRPEAIADIVRAVVDARPDVLVFLGSSPSLAAYLSGVRAARPTLPIIGSDAVSSWERTTVPRALWQHVSYVDFVDMSATPALQSFSRRFAERTGRMATGPDVLTYDATRLLLQAVAEGATTGEAVRAYVASLGRERAAYAAVSGPLQFSPEGDPERPFVLRMTEPVR
jgi:branched-chain amino acid transport system substrate-binding protein